MVLFPKFLDIGEALTNSTIIQSAAAAAVIATFQTYTKIGFVPFAQPFLIQRAESQKATDDWICAHWSDRIS